MKKIKNSYTYLRGRKCEHCEAPIPDHLHESRKHCLPIVYEDGFANDCKVKKNNVKAGIKNKEAKAILEEQKQLLERVKKLVELKGIIVTTEDLNFHMISLFKAYRYEKIKSRVISFFNGFRIETHHWKNKHFIFFNG